MDGYPKSAEDLDAFVDAMRPDPEKSRVNDGDEAEESDVAEKESVVLDAKVCRTHRTSFVQHAA